MFVLCALMAQNLFIHDNGYVAAFSKVVKHKDLVKPYADLNHEYQHEAFCHMYMSSDVATVTTKFRTLGQIKGRQRY